MQIAMIKGEITLADGSKAYVEIDEDYGWRMFGCTPSVRGRHDAVVNALNALTDALKDAELMGSDASE